MRDIPFFFDEGPVAWIQGVMGHGWPLPWELVSLMGASWGILLAVGLGLWLWGRRAAYALLAVMALDGALKMALNKVLFVPRPEGGELIKYERVGVGSFPSGHVSTVAALWGWLAHRAHISWWLAGAVILLQGLSRLYLGVHYIGDILGGMALAAVTIALASWLWPPVRDWLAARSFLFFVGAAVLALAGVVAGAFFYFGGNPYKWRAGGLVAGLAIGLPIEYRWVRYQPAKVGAWRKTVMVLIGVTGIGAMAAVDQFSGLLSNSLGLATAALAALWAVLVSPTLFTLLGWAERDDPRREITVGRVARGLAVATAVLALVVGYGGAIEPRLILDTEEHEAPIPNLPGEWDGATVAVVSDFQLGLWLDNTAMMERAVAAIVERDPDLALLAGDFVYEPGHDTGAVVRGALELVRPLVAAEIPTYAVLGNHDWGLPRPLGKSESVPEAARQLRDSLTAAGITVLHNRSTRVRAPDRDAPLYLAGVGSHYAERDDPAAAVAGIPPGAPRLVMMHNPTSFETLPAHSAPLAVAGHTHGGQIRLPFSPQWSWLTFTEDDDVHVDGWVEENYGAAGNRLYVTRGVGMSVIPLRINCPPEITFFTLRRDTTGTRQATRRDTTGTS
jgi:hypothetical protein